jgi:hypothetical protein
MRFTLLASLVAALVGVGAAVASAQGGPTGGTGLGTTSTTTTTTTTTTSTVTAPPPPAPGGANPFKGRAMWIWELGSSDRGNVASIAATARQYGIGTVIVKSSDGTGAWSQFTPTLVQTLHAAGIHVCAWQYVYGDHPITEAQLGAAAVEDGADCLVIDAEVEYQGKYAQAQSYIAALRKLIGANFPVALAGFPYVDFHPSFPYSVFLGPGGAQYNAPQMYWADIGVSVDQVYSHTYMWNRPYNRPIYPLGDLPARRGLRPAPAASDPPLPPGLARVRGARRQLVGLAGGADQRLARTVAAGRPVEQLQAGPGNGDPGDGRRGRPCRLGPGAPRDRRRPAQDRRRIRR